jgi:hypothetical protein
MPILLNDLISKLPSETEDKVRRAKERFNERIREALRRETRLSLYRGAGDGREKRDDVIQVPISIDPGLPEALVPSDKQKIEDKYHLAILLGPHRERLTQLRDSGKSVAENLLPLLQKDLKATALLNGGDAHVKAASDYADFLLRKLNEFQLTDFILQVNEDVLGDYSYKVHRAYDEPKPKIRLFWGVIGLVAQDLGVKVEDLAGVVLAHELGHAYTHVGSDADDHCWSSALFSASEHELKEGLAQYYTLRVCLRLKEFHPALLAAYEALLPHQPAAYQVHTVWNDATAERVRLAMLETRRSRYKGTLKDFKGRLRMANDQLADAQAAGVDRLF